MISTATEQDGEPLIVLAADAGNFRPDEVACVEELWASYLAKGEASGYYFVVCREGERVVGFACFGPHPLTEGTYDLYWICTARDMRGRGIGGALLAHVESEVKARGGRLLVVETSSLPSYASARRFYETYGYRFESVIHDFYMPGDDMVLYAKPLAPPAMLLSASPSQTSASQAEAAA
ncbi:MAG: GNAT family N-acetyltransferase [Anaerolineales bacterium]|nr:GNAT family N-acetyltransferase [Anaerolineales bacterium]